MRAGALDRETLLEARRIQQRSIERRRSRYRGHGLLDIRRYHRSRNKAKHHESR
jgi:hypothetical protein